MYAQSDTCMFILYFEFWGCFFLFAGLILTNTHIYYDTSEWRVLNSSCNLGYAFCTKAS